jgi:hypothetical protein
MAKTRKLYFRASINARDFTLSPMKAMIYKSLKSTHGPDIQEERFIRSMLFAIFKIK